MRTYLKLLLVVPLCACADRASVTATITNNLAVDGCSYPVTIDSVEYAPDAASLPEIREHARMGSTTVTVDYHVTGNVARVECGFGTFRELPEIHVDIVGS